MAEVSLFIAASLDGFIADPEGGVGWLFTNEDYGYEAFFASDFARAGLIDEVVLSIHPVLLGGGAPLFEGPRPRQDLDLVDSRSYESGLVQLTYRRKIGRV